MRRMFTRIGSIAAAASQRSEDIRHARELLSGATYSEPHIRARIEVCDATVPYVEEHLDEVGGPFLPGRVWCDWGSRLVRAVPAP